MTSSIAPDAEVGVRLSVAAKKYGVHARTLLRRVQDGTLPAQRFGPKLILVRMHDVEKLLQPVEAARDAA